MGARLRLSLANAPAVSAGSGVIWGDIRSDCCCSCCSMVFSCTPRALGRMKPAKSAASGHSAHLKGLLGTGGTAARLHGGRKRRGGREMVLEVKESNETAPLALTGRPSHHGACEWPGGR